MWFTINSSSFSFILFTPFVSTIYFILINRCCTCCQHLQRNMVLQTYITLARWEMKDFTYISLGYIAADIPSLWLCNLHMMAQPLATISIFLFPKGIVQVSSFLLCYFCLTLFLFASTQTKHWVTSFLFI